MLNWICPDCGRECSPASRECPGCAEQSQISAQATPAPMGVLALAKSVENDATTGLISAESDAPVTHSFNGSESVHSTSVLVEEPAVPEPAEPTGQTLDAFVENLEEQISSHLAAAPEVEPSPQSLVSEPWPVEPIPDARQEDSVDQQAIGAIVDSFREQPRTLLLGAPQKVEYPAPPVTTFFALDRPPAAHPSDVSSRQTMATPQPVLLPGPCLPHDLRNLPTNRAHTAPPGAGKLKLPAWVISLFAAMLLVLLVGSIMQNMSASRDAKAASVPTDTAAQSPTTPEAVSPDAHPFGRYVEVTGVRVVADPQRRSQLQYLVVNHSNIQITGIALHISVRSADPSSKAPLIQVSAVIPSLGAYESKEIRTDLDTQIRSTEIPDWDHLKVDVQVTSR